MPSTNSPLRYPGGKSQLANFIAHTLELNHLEHSTYCEAFCGGSGVAMTLLLKDKVNRVILNDYDPAIYSVWYAILHDTHSFIERIQNTPITIAEWYHQKDIYNHLKNIHEYNIDLAYSAFFLNRTNRSGIIESRPIGGFEQNSKYKINCRFNVINLVRKIEKIQALHSRIELYNLDGLEFIRRIIAPMNTDNIFIFFDPPYFNQGQKLYKNSLTPTYHEQLSHSIKALQHNHWIVTYDDVIDIRNLYADCEGWKYDIHYTANTKRIESELLYKSPATVIESFERVHFQNLQ